MLRFRQLSLHDPQLSVKSTHIQWIMSFQQTCHHFTTSIYVSPLNAYGAYIITHTFQTLTYENLQCLCWGGSDITKMKQPIRMPNEYIWWLKCSVSRIWWTSQLIYRDCYLRDELLYCFLAKQWYHVNYVNINSQPTMSLEDEPIYSHVIAGKFNRIWNFKKNVYKFHNWPIQRVKKRGKALLQRIILHRVCGCFSEVLVQ